MTIEEFCHKDRLRRILITNYRLRVAINVIRLAGRSADTMSEFYSARLYRMDLRNRRLTDEEVQELRRRERQEYGY